MKNNSFLRQHGHLSYDDPVVAYLLASKIYWDINLYLYSLYEIQNSNFTN